ncbi:MAG TPA: GNAT family N-acetyltransferase [Rhodoferax sp.]
MSKEGPIYAVESEVSLEEFRLLLIESGLGVRRPVDDSARLESMLRNASLIVTARIDGVLVGIARSVTDFVFCCYLSDLAVSKRAQGRGIGAQLIERTREHLGPTVSVILSSVPECVGFYESIKMSPLPSGFWFRRER